MGFLPYILPNKIQNYPIIGRTNYIIISDKYFDIKWIYSISNFFGTNKNGEGVKKSEHNWKSIELYETENI